MTAYLKVSVPSYSRDSKRVYGAVDTNAAVQDMYCHLVDSMTTTIGYCYSLATAQLWLPWITHK